MSTDRELRDFVSDIHQSISDIQDFISDMDFEVFKADRKTVNAVIRSLEIIGEATKNVPMSVRHQYPSVPWKEIAGMRDKLIHNYFGVDLEIVWETIQSDLPGIEDALGDFFEQNT